MSTYHAPNWMQNPSSGWKLDEIKNGIIVNSYDLNNALISFGRTPGIKGATGIFTAHESCSRLHARIAFDSNGTPWLRDLGSGNGTKVNKKPLPKKACGKVENLKGEGCRGVVLYPGDVITFGASTRVYVLDGPREFDRGYLKASQQQALLMKHQTSSKDQSIEGSIESNGDNSTAFDATEIDSSISWGIDFDDIETREEAEKSLSSNVDIQDIPNKHKKLYQNIEAKKAKLHNIQQEIQRIQAKSVTTELTNGQLKQVDSLEKREKDLLHELQELEMTLRDRMEQSNRHSPMKRDRSMSREDEDVDDFYDQTCPKRAKLLQKDGNHVETDASLIHRCKALFFQLKTESSKVDMYKEKAQSFVDKLKSTSDTDEDYFFIKNDLDLANDELNAAMTSFRSAVDAIDEVQKLLRLINDKIVIDRDIYFIGDQAQHQEALLRVKSEKTEGKIILPPPSSIPNNSNDSMAMPPPPMTSPKVNDSVQMPPPPVITSLKTNSSLPMPPPNRRIMNNQGNTNSNVEKKSEEKKGDVAPRRKGPQRPPQGTLSFLSSSADKHSSKAQISPNEASKTGAVHGILDSKKDQWVAPSNQDGSGITKLNAKFNGRY